MAQQPQLSVEFRDFLVEAKTHGYGTGAAEKITLGSGATEITYEDAGWLYTDNYVGGDPFSGYEHVSVRHPSDAKEWLPVWAMSYQGAILTERLSGRTLAKLLGEVLIRPDAVLPARGPGIHFFMDNWGRYEFRAKGSLENFLGNELIGRDPQHAVYRAQFMGGLVNRNTEFEALRPKWLEQNG